MHALRHYHASVLLLLGVPDKYAMQDLGQNSPYMLKQVYQHLFSDKMADFYQSLSSHYADFL